MYNGLGWYAFFGVALGAVCWVAIYAVAEDFEAQYNAKGQVQAAQRQRLAIAAGPVGLCCYIVDRVAVLFSPEAAIFWRATSWAAGTLAVCAVLVFVLCLVADGLSWLTTTKK